MVALVTLVKEAVREGSFSIGFYRSGVGDDRWFLGKDFDGYDLKDSSVLDVRNGRVWS